MKKLKLTWYDVLNHKQGGKWWGYIDNFLPVVADVGYEYFVWNWRIYRIIKYTDTPSSLSYEDTGLSVADIKG